MKTQNFGVVPAAYPIKFPNTTDSRNGTPLDLLNTLEQGLTETSAIAALKDYRANRENGKEEDNPKRPFPSAGLEMQDAEGLHIEFDYGSDEERNKNDKSRYWFVMVHCKSKLVISGFSQEVDYTRGGHPKRGKNYWSCVKFNDEACPPIREWMEEKDANYRARMEKKARPELEAAKQKEQETIKQQLAMQKLQEKVKAQKQEITHLKLELANRHVIPSAPLSASATPFWQSSGSSGPSAGGVSTDTSVLCANPATNVKRKRGAPENKAAVSTAPPLPISPALFQPAEKRLRSILKEAVAIHAYQARNAEQLSFPRNAVLIVLEEHNSNWYLCELNGKKGLVPANRLNFNELSTESQPQELAPLIQKNVQLRR